MYGPYKAFWWLRGTGCSSGSAGAHSARRTSRATIIIGRAETKSDMTFKTSFVEPSSWTEPLTAYIQNTAHNNTHMRASLIFVYTSVVLLSDGGCMRVALSSAAIASLLTNHVIATAVARIIIIRRDTSDVFCGDSLEPAGGWAALAVSAALRCIYIYSANTRVVLRAAELSIDAGGMTNCRCAMRLYMSAKHNSVIKYIYIYIYLRNRPHFIHASCTPHEHTQRNGDKMLIIVLIYKLL